MTHTLQSDRHFEESVETFFKHMGYHTRTNTVLHTRSVHIHAHLNHPKEKHKIMVECKHAPDPVGVHEVQKFCSKVAFARENAETDYGVLVSNTGFSEEAVSWLANHCSFVRLRTYKEIMVRSATITKLAKKFHHYKNLT